MKKIILLYIFLSVLCFANENDILGKWKTDNGDIIEIYKKENKFYGKIVKLVEPIYPKNHPLSGIEKMDINNPDKSMRKRKIIGMIFLMDFEYKKGKYRNGKIYDPKSGNTYFGKITYKNNKLYLKGSIDNMGLLGRTEIWIRVNE